MSPRGRCSRVSSKKCLTNFAYDWAFSQPLRKVSYNLVVTGLSVADALVIGTIELAGLVPANCTGDVECGDGSDTSG